MKRTLCVVSLTYALLVAGAETALAQFGPGLPSASAPSVSSPQPDACPKSGETWSRFLPSLEALKKLPPAQLEQIMGLAFDCLETKGTTAEEREPAHYLLEAVAFMCWGRQNDAYNALVKLYNDLAADHDHLLASVRQWAGSAAQARSTNSLANGLAAIAQGMAAAESRYQPPKQLHCTTQHVGTTSYTNCQEY